MKKILAIILCLALAVSLCACGMSSAKDDIEDALDKAESTLSEIIESTKLTRGTISGNVYKSEFSGITFTRPDSWVYSTDEEIASALGVGADLLGIDTDFAKLAEDSGSVYDMMVKDINTGTTINLGYENLAKSSTTNMTEKQYLDVFKNQFAAVTTMTVVFEGDYETVKLGEKDYLRAVCKTTMNGIERTQVYYVRKIDKYMNYVIVTIVDGYTISDIEAMFS